MKRSAIKPAEAKPGGKNGIAAAPQAPPAPPEVAPAQAAPKPKAYVHPVRRALGPVASLRLTVVLLALSLFLVFAGTLAMIDTGIPTTTDHYFRSVYVWIPFNLFLKFGQIFFRLPESWSLPGSFPFPAGLTLGFALLINLLAAHAVRFKLSWKRAGIITLHAGLILMLVGEFITGQFAVEGNMPIENQLTCNYVESRKKYELAVVNTTDPKQDVEVAVPASMLKKGGVISHPGLPFDVVVEKYFDNSSLYTEKGKLEAREEPVTSGASTSGEDAPAAYITLRKKGTDETVDKFLVSLWFTDWTMRRVAESPSDPDDPDSAPKITRANKPRHAFEYDGAKYDVALRWQRTYKPYTIALEEFRHDLYPGTNKPKNFSSKIHLVNAEQGDERETTVLMNSPMRYRGEAFYQSGWLPGDRGTVLQVVRNPGWMLPYLSCTLVSLGMAIHFGMYLINYLRRRPAL
jgi:hypothetical protein